MNAFIPQAAIGNQTARKYPTAKQERELILVTDTGPVEVSEMIDACGERLKAVGRELNGDYIFDLVKDYAAVAEHYTIEEFLERSVKLACDLPNADGAAVETC